MGWLWLDSFLDKERKAQWILKINSATISKFNCIPIVFFASLRWILILVWCVCVCSLTNDMGKCSGHHKHVWPVHILYHSKCEINRIFLQSICKNKKVNFNKQVKDNTFALKRWEGSGVGVLFLLSPCDHKLWHRIYTHTRTHKTLPFVKKKIYSHQSWWGWEGEADFKGEKMKAFERRRRQFKF